MSDARLSGIRLDEAHARAQAKRWRGAPEPENFFTWEWIRWYFGTGYTRSVDAFDAERAWENEGGR